MRDKETYELKNMGNKSSNLFLIVESQNEEIDNDLKVAIHQAVGDAKKFIEKNFDASKALASIFEIFSKANKYIEVTEP